MPGGPGPRVPMVVLGGWLGAGKTTLVNRLLRATNGERIAVVVNDIGEVNLDVGLIAARDGDTVELANGCICCSIGDSLAVTLRDLVLAGQSSNRQLDRLVVEASGVAEPDRVAAYGDRRRIRPDGIVVAVDATDVVIRAADPACGPLVLRQIRAADLLVVTKADLVPDGGLGAVAWCTELAPDVPIVIADSPEGANPDGADRWVQSVLGSPALGASSVGSTDSTGEDGNHGDGDSLAVGPALDLPVETAMWRASGPVDVDRLAASLASLVNQLGPALLRAKAVVEALDGTTTAIHLAAGRVTIEPVMASVPESAAGVLVAITTPGVLTSLDLTAVLDAGLATRAEGADRSFQENRTTPC
ncbi:MAG: GTP-binding protein [Acidimicrobiales bacterium]|nr:GTP-binding protein [Acidimicrobiales bacterium]